jgi:GNAT superfamily N-acetyltransferase
MLQHRQIRPANQEDVPALAVLMGELGYPTTEQEMRQRFSSIANDLAYRTFIAASGSEVLGMAGAMKGFAFEQNGCYVRLTALVTRQTDRGKGIGKMLVHAVEEWAIASNASAIFLNCGNRDERVAAHQFYLKLGFAAKSTGYVKRL